MMYKQYSPTVPSILPSHRCRTLRKEDHRRVTSRGPNLPGRNERRTTGASDHGSRGSTIDVLLVLRSETVRAGHDRITPHPWDHCRHPLARANDDDLMGGGGCPDNTFVVEPLRRVKREAGTPTKGDALIKKRFDLGGVALKKPLSQTAATATRRKTRDGGEELTTSTSSHALRRSKLDKEVANMV
jgi:hypothetical protein